MKAALSGRIILRYQVARLAARAVFVRLFSPFFPQKQAFSVNNHPDSHHLQGGMKFATQISPLLN